MSYLRRSAFVSQSPCELAGAAGEVFGAPPSAKPGPPGIGIGSGIGLGVGVGTGCAAPPPWKM
jgi:hypothetical protein